MATKILVCCDNLVSPTIETSGVKNIYELFLELNADVHFLTTGRPSAHLKNFHFIKSENFIFQRFLYLFWAVFLNWKHGFSHIVEFSSSPLMINRSGLLRKLTRARITHVLCTANDNFQKHLRFIWFWPHRVQCTLESHLKILASLSGKALCYYLPIPVKDPPRTDKPVTSKTRISFIGLFGKRKGADQYLKLVPIILQKYPWVEMRFYTAPHRKEEMEKPNEVLRGLESFGDRFRLVEEIGDVYAWLLETDIFIYPITTMHGTLNNPSILIEALLAGTAVVATDLPEIRELISSEDQGLLFKDFEDLQRKVERLIEDLNLRRELRTQASQRGLEYRRSQLLAKYKSLFL